MGKKTYCCVLFLIAMVFLVRPVLKPEPYHQGKFEGPWGGNNYGRYMLMNVRIAVAGGYADSAIGTFKNVNYKFFRVRSIGWGYENYWVPEDSVRVKNGT